MLKTCMIIFMKEGLYMVTIICICGQCLDKYVLLCSGSNRTKDSLCKPGLCGLLRHRLQPPGAFEDARCQYVTVKLPGSGAHLWKGAPLQTEYSRDTLCCARCMTIDMNWGCIQALSDVLKQITDVSCLHVIASPNNFHPNIWNLTLSWRDLPKHRLDELVLPLHPGLGPSLRMWPEVCVHSSKISLL